MANLHCQCEHEIKEVKEVKEVKECSELTSGCWNRKRFDEAVPNWLMEWKFGTSDETGSVYDSSKNSKNAREFFWDLCKAIKAGSGPRFLEIDGMKSAKHESSKVANFEKS